jgi:hypothetical protein
MSEAKASGWVRLMDSDWVNIVNHPEVLGHGNDSDLAVACAVGLTEARLRELNTTVVRTDSSQPWTPERCRNYPTEAAQLLNKRPLDEGRLFALLMGCTAHPPERLPPGYVAFARAVERAHGIQGAQS